MHFMTFFPGVIGGLMLLGSIVLAIYVTANSKELKTWKPFGWSGVLGALTFVAAVFTAGDEHSAMR